MRKVAIVGAGQGGLQLGFGLLKAGYAVTLYSDMTAARLLASGARPVTIQFGPSVKLEEELDLRFWSANRYADVDDVYMAVFAPTGERAFRIDAAFDKPAQCLDLRMKFSRWLEEFERRGGQLIIEQCDVGSLERMAVEFDLVVVAAGRKGITQLFPEDRSKMEFDKPQRNVSMFYAQGCDMRAGLPGVAVRQITRYSIVADAGEVIVSGFLSKSGAEHHYVQFEAIPGGPMDLFDCKADVPGQYQKGLDWLRSHQPEIHRQVANSSVTAEREWVCGAILPTVRAPVGRLPSGRVVFGMGDTVVVNDPILAQGLNAASKWAAMLTRQIIEHGAAPFTAQWIESAFDAYWQTAEYNTKFTNTALRAPTPLQQRVMAFAAQNLGFGRRLMNCIGEAHTLHPWFWDEHEAEKMMATYL